MLRKNMSLAGALILAATCAVACGTPDVTVTNTPSEEAPPADTVQVFTDTKDQCDARREACVDLASRGIDSCRGQAQLAAISQCVGETVDCFNAADATYTACEQAERRCVEQGSPEIRTCVRACNATFIQDQAVCTSSQSLALEECGRNLGNANQACHDQARNVYEACIDPHEDTRTTCEGSVRATYNACIAALDSLETNCRNECPANDGGCWDTCRQAREQARIRCDTDQQIGFDACRDALSSAELGCRGQERSALAMCLSNIPSSLRTCSDNAFRDGRLCQERAQNKSEDCRRACDPLGSERCDMGCRSAANMAYGKCFQDDWSCFTRRTVEGSTACESEGHSKVSACFDEADACKARDNSDS